MKLRDAVDRYIAWRREHGAKFTAGANILHHFCRYVGEGTGCDQVSEEQVHSYLAGTGKLTGYRANKYSTLTVFYQFAVSRCYATRSPLPLPEQEPPRPAAVPPHIFTQQELRHLFGAIDASRRGAFQLDAVTFRTFLLLLYGAGLRQGEARRLSVEDVDLRNAVLTVRDSKFYKSRLVPTGPDLTKAIGSYAAERSKRPFPQGVNSTFLANRDGSPLAAATLKGAFKKVLHTAGVQQTDASRRAPCLHSFRHTFAVHRLIDWYRADANVQQLLPALSTYLGHANPAGTQIYLSMTPELLREASVRFERYTNACRNGDPNHA